MSAGTVIVQPNQSLVILTTLTQAINTFFRSGRQVVTAGSKLVVITFNNEVPNTSYIVVPGHENLVDANPIFQPLTITDKLKTGFTVSANAPWDSANSFISYVVIGINDP